MPVTFQVANHPASEFVRTPARPPTAQTVLEAACPSEAEQCAELLQSSINGKDTSHARLVPDNNGFVHAVIEAYGGHHHLKLKPDDVWIAILSQLSYYIRAHAEELRAYFVAHEGKKPLVVQYSSGTRHTVDYADFARCMSNEIHNNVVDKTLVEWILPDFTTTTHNDTTVCAIIAMATLQKYFDYTLSITCGIPSVTLEGTRDDWVRLFARLARLPELGPEPAAWAYMLRPILARFVRAFDGAPDVEFWSHVAHRNDEACGMDLLSGWITAFCVWGADGRWRGWRPAEILRAAQGANEGTSVMVQEESVAYTLDGIPYFEMGVSDVPAGFGEVPVMIDDNGEEFPSVMVAGHVAFAVSSSAGAGSAGAKLDTIRPSPEWFVFTKRDEDHPMDIT